MYNGNTSLFLPLHLDASNGKYFHDFNLNWYLPIFFCLVVNSWKYEKENKLMKYYANRWNIRWINWMGFKLNMMNFPLFSPVRPFFPRTIIIYRNSFSDDKLNFIKPITSILRFGDEILSF